MPGGPTPDKGYKPRSTGDHLTPESATPRSTPSQRGGRIRPERTKPRATGDAMSNTLPHNQVDPIVIGPTGDSKSTVNPIPGKSTGGKPPRGKNVNPLK